jgi:membrane protein YfhO
MLGLPGLAVWGVVWAVFYVLSVILFRRGALGRDWHRDTLAVGVLASVVLGFYWPLFFTESWIPKGGGDLASFIYPLYSFGARWLKQGVVPLWNPHLYMGMPFAADNQSGLFYPVNLLFFVLLPEMTYEAVELMAVSHVFLAGLFAYIFLRDLPTFRVVNATDQHLGRLPAMAGAIAYMFSDLFVVHPGNLNIIATAAWLPLALLGLRRALQRRSWGWAAGSGVVLGMAALAGHAQMLLYVGIALGLYTLFELYVHRGEGWKRALGRFLLFVTAGIVAFGVASVSLIPAYDMTSYTVRASMRYADASAFSIPPAGLVSIFLPGFFGRGTGPFWGPWSRTEMGYVGVLPIMLALIATVLTWHRSTLTRFWVFLGAVGLLIALGPDTILHGWTYALIPVFRQLRVPARAVFLFDFAVAMLAASGLDVLLHPLSRSARRLLGLVGRGLSRIAGALALVGLPILGHAVLTSRMSVPQDVLSQHVASMGSLVFFLLVLGAGLGGLVLRQKALVGSTMLGMLTVTVIGLDLLSQGAYVEAEPNNPLASYDHDEELAFLRSDLEPYRVETTTDVHGSWAPDWALIDGMDDLNGIWNPLRLGAYDVLTWVGIQRGDPFYNLYNVRYLITSRETAVPDHFELAFDRGTQPIYRNTQALPRAFMVYDVLLADGDIAALGMARSADFDPRTQIVLKRDSASVLPSTSAKKGQSSVLCVGRGPNHIDFEVSTLVDGYLFVSEMWMPGWEADVDGRKQEVLQANYTFRAVHVAAGTHRIHMVYRPVSWFVGLGITLATIVVLLTWAGWSLVNRQRA